MRYSTLNGITRSYLTQVRRPIHYYYRCLKFSSDCLREILFDSLRIINTVRLPVDEFFECAIPNDCVDWCKVGVQVGQLVRPLIQKNTINNLPRLSSTDGTQLNYANLDQIDEWPAMFQWWGVNINTNGENTGGYYGLGAGSEPDTFKFIPERNVIVVNQNLCASTIVLEYLSDGTYSNSATRVTPYAQKTIEAYIDWQYKLQSKSYGAYDHESAERQFYAQLRILRARKNDLTPDDVERIMNRNRKASLK